MLKAENATPCPTYRRRPDLKGFTAPYSNAAFNPHKKAPPYGRASDYIFGRNLN